VALIGLGGNVLTAEIALADDREVGVGRVVITGMAVASGNVAVWLNDGATMVVGAGTKVGIAAVDGRVAG
jgi:hypothetical protein